MAVTVRCPGARTAPVMRTFTCCHTGREKTGAKTPMALLKAIGKESIAILSSEENRGFHCRSIVTQIPINGQSRAENFYHDFFYSAGLVEKAVSSLKEGGTNISTARLYQMIVENGDKVMTHYYPLSLSR